MLLRLIRKPLLSIIMLGYLFLSFSQSVGAAADGRSWEVITGYDYFHIRDGLPDSYQDQLAENNRLVDLSLGYITGNNNGQFSLSLDGKGNAGDLKINLKEFAWSGNEKKVLYEVGKTRWVWGRGLSFIPTCPLDIDTYYWGGQGSLINPGNSLTIGVAMAKDSYNSNTSATILMADQASDSDYTGWLRSGWLFETSDLTAVVTYQSAEMNWNYGLDFSRDLQNGFELHGGASLRSSDSTVNYLIGGEYVGKYFYTAEFYHSTDDLLIFAISNSAGMMGRWQWMLREIYNLDDDGEIRKLNLSYTKNDQIVPQLEISMNAGPRSSKYRQNPVDYYIIFKVTSKF